MRSVLLARACAAFLLLGIFAPAFAHKASDAYLQLQRTPSGLALRWDIALRDLDAALDLDADRDLKLTWGEVRTRLPEIQALARTHLRLDEGRCVPALTQPPAVEERVDGNYLVLQMAAPCAPGDAAQVEYGLFRDIDPTHRGLLRIAGAAGAAPGLYSLDPAAGPVRVALPPASAETPVITAAAATTETPPEAGTGFFANGMHHILIGYDHLLFLICLLLPAVLRRDGQALQPVARWQDAAWPIVALVTMFTVGHSVTLALAGLGLMTLSPRLVEPAIALTIIVAAADNLRPFLHGRRRLFALLFGLVHGFGFAGVLGELALPQGSFVAALLAFNLGVEAGQLLVVAVVLTGLLLLRRWRKYPAVVLRGGSVLAIGLALVWFVERVFDLQVLPA